MIHEYAAIDPMALLFPSRIYISISEKLHPHVPKSIEIKEAVGKIGRASCRERVFRTV